MTRDDDNDLTAFLDLQLWVAYDVNEDGSVLAGSDATGTFQLVEIRPDGARIPLTELDGRCTGRYVPDTGSVVVMHDSGGDENWQLSLLDLDGPLPAREAGLKPLVHDPRFMHALEDVTAEHLVYSTNRRDGATWDVVVRDWATGTEHMVAEDAGFVAESRVSPDGKRCALVSLTTKAASTQLSVVGGAAPVALTPDDEHAEHSSPHWLSDDELVFASNRDRDFKAIVRAGADGSGWHTVLTDDAHDLQVSAPAGGSTLLVLRNDDGVHHLALHEPDGALRAVVDLAGDRAVTSGAWSHDGAHVVLGMSGPTDPGSIVTVDARTGAVTWLVDGLDQIEPNLRDRVVPPTCHRVPTPDGEEVPCFVYRPENASGASVLHIHGGPEAQAMRVWNPVIQTLTLAGFTVLQPNVRGSDGYGKRWVSLDDVDLRLDSVEDLRALHTWLPSLGLDADRAALWGGSYGGYMVLAGLATQPELWAAGIDIVGISSLVTFLENTSAYRRIYREREYGSLEHDRETLVRCSPITYLDRMSAPLFVIHGANDPRVPLSEAEQIEAALTAKGITCELRVYADEGHGLAKRANRIDAYPAAINFLLETTCPHD